MSIDATDTHALIYFANRNHRLLSPRARDVFEHAKRREALILVPAPALWEVSLLEKLGHVRLSRPYEEWRRTAERQRGHASFNLRCNGIWFWAKEIYQGGHAATL